MKTYSSGEAEETPNELNATVEVTPTTVIAIMSSKEDAAMRVVGIPFSTPYPYDYRIIQEGTRMAGLTAPNVNPKVMQSTNGRPIM
jgi:hypothetical protein